MPRWGNLNIGTGIGDAQAYNPMPVVQQYAQTLAENQARHQQEVQMLGDQLAKGYDPSGLRNDADKSAYIDRYNKIKDEAINAENERDITKKALALAGVRQRLHDLSAFSAGSKKQGVFERQIALQHLNNPYLLDDNSATNLHGQLGKVWDDPSVIKDATGFERGVDPGKIDSKIEKHVNDVLKHSPVTYDNGVVSKNPNTIDGKKLFTVTQNRVVPFQDAYESTLNLASSDRDYQKFLDQKYPDIKTDNPQTTLALRVKQDMMNRGYDKGFYDKPKTRDLEGQAPQRWTLQQLWNMKHYGTPNAPGSIAEGAEPVTVNIPYKGGTANVEAQGYVPLSISKKNFAGSPAYSLTDGKPVKALESSGDYEVVGVGNFPFIKAGAPGAGTIAQPNFVKQNGQYVEQRPMIHIQKPATKDEDAQDYVIDYDKLPANIKNSKPVQQALKNFHSAVTGQQTPVAAKATPPAGGMIRVKLPNGSIGEIPATRLGEFKKNYPGAEKID